MIFVVGAKAVAKDFSGLDTKNLCNQELTVVKRSDSFVTIESKEGTTVRFKPKMAKDMEWGTSEPIYFFVPVEHKSYLGVEYASHC